MDRHINIALWEIEGERVALVTVSHVEGAYRLSVQPGRMYNAGFGTTGFSSIQADRVVEELERAPFERAKLEELSEDFVTFARANLMFRRIN
jgi:hypothetical protein